MPTESTHIYQDKIKDSGAKQIRRRIEYKDQYRRKEEKFHLKVQINNKDKSQVLRDDLNSSLEFPGVWYFIMKGKKKSTHEIKKQTHFKFFIEGRNLKYDFRKVKDSPLWERKYCSVNTLRSGHENEPFTCPVLGTPWLTQLLHIHHHNCANVTVPQLSPTKSLSGAGYWC